MIAASKNSCLFKTPNSYLLTYEPSSPISILIYASSGLYPLHMPGYKRLVVPAPGLPAGWDMTEVPGVDDLHDADGILADAMARTAALWGAKRTWYLVNGSTCGILAAIRAAVVSSGPHRRHLRAQLPQIRLPRY